ncbi:ras protein [Mycena alexandri]|uniref:Ras protein n=1 Tax=Mycena alexandri TaxID=1745969 RepID=A0AAD6T0W5_9AGAR|nr:ras protein [Mycena alexandri]
MDAWTVILLGGEGVGKTALADMYTINHYWDVLQPDGPPLEPVYRKQLLLDNRMCFIDVTDTPGQDDYATLRDQRIQECQGFIFVYSITSRSSFEQVQIFRQAVRRIKRGDPILLLVGNKADMGADREVSKEEGQALARQFGCEFIETSVKTGLNVERAFETLLRTLRRTREGVTPNIVEPAETKKKKCTIL